MVQLLQPLDQLAVISRNLGRYRVEDELLYRRKKLELIIAKENDLAVEQIALRIADWFYGFGYKRKRAFYWFIQFFLLGVLVAYIQLRGKQIKLLKKTIELRNNELADEKILTKNITIRSIEDTFNFIKNNGFKLTNDTTTIPKVPPSPIIVEPTDSTDGLILGEKCHDKLLSFEHIKPYLDSMDRIVFFGHYDPTGKTDGKKIYLGLKPDLEDEEIRKILNVPIPFVVNNDIEFVAVNLEGKDNEDIKYLVENIDERSKNNRKAGICDNLLPNSGLYLVYSVKDDTSQYDLYSLEEEGKILHYATKRNIKCDYGVYRER